MRLTLRTLLAYRDRVLNPAELHDMHGRVQQSAMAGNLLKRIDALSQRNNILAPPVDGKGLGADANSIAEYLDDTLKGEKVPELERICLESDVQLAELSHCHELLSSALSTSIDVPPALRERIAALGDRAVREKALADRPTGLNVEPEVRQAAIDEARADSRPSDKNFRKDAPHASHTSNGRAASQAAYHARVDDVADSLPEAGSSVASANKDRLVTAQPVAAPMVASRGDSIRPTGLDLEGSHLAHEVPEYLRGRSSDGWRGPLAIGALVAVLCLLVWQSIGSWSSVREMLVRSNNENESKETPAAPSNNNSNNAAANNNSNNSGNNTERDNAPTGDNSAGQAPATNKEANSPTIANGNASVSAPNGNKPATDQPLVPTLPPNGQKNPGNATGAVTQPALEWLPADPESMNAVVFVQRGGTEPTRLQAAQSVASGAQLFVPTASRPKLDLLKGPNWTVCGPTHLLIVTADGDASNVPAIDLQLGKALVTSSNRGNTLRILTPDSQVQLSLADGAQVAIDLSYLQLAHGPVIDRASHPPVLFVAAVQGTVTVQATALKSALNNGVASKTLAAGQALFVSRGQSTEPQAAELPVWLDAASERPVDLKAAEDLAQQLGNGESVLNTLTKLATNRRPETRAMAAQALSLLGNWEWVALPKSTLGDSRDRSYWGPLLDATRQMLAAHPTNVAALEAALAKQDAASSGMRAQMWLGFTQAQLEGDALTKLVDNLDSEQLIDRILAIYQLQRLTGKDLGYQAGEVNRSAVQQWTRELAAGRVQVLKP